jgi:hypothetical protein
MKKIYGHHPFYFVGGISKVGDEQFVFAKKIVGNSPRATQKLQYKFFHNREFIQIDTTYH